MEETKRMTGCLFMALVVPALILGSIVIVDQRGSRVGGKSSMSIPSLEVQSKQIETLQDDLNLIRESVAMTLKDIAQPEPSLASGPEKLSQISNDLETLRNKAINMNQFQVLRTEMEVLQGQKTVCLKLVALLQEKVKFFESERHAVSHNLTDLATTLLHRHSQVEQLGLQITNLTNHNIELETERRKQVEQLSLQIRDLTARNTQTETERAAQAAGQLQRSTLVEEINNKIEDLTTHNNQIETERRAETAQLQKRVNDLSVQLSEAKRQSAGAAVRTEMKQLKKQLQQTIDRNHKLSIAQQKQRKKLQSLENSMAYMSGWK